MRRLLFVVFALVSLFACRAPEQSPSTTAASELIANLRSQYAPDKRVARWWIQDTLEHNQVVLRGETNLPEAKSALLQELQKQGISYLDSITLLPHADLEGQVYGLVNVSVANIRSEDKHWGEMASQALLGTPLKIMKKVRDGWYYVQSPDGYLGYLDQGAFITVDEATFQNWQVAPKVVYWKDFGFSLLNPTPKSPRVSDLVAGALLERGQSSAAYTEVKYPDGRVAFVANAEIRPIENWLSEADPSPTAFLTTAKSMLGRPYLWGGTSGKGMDCSGFTKTVFYLHGMILQRDASQQVHTGLEIPFDSTLSQIQAGDFLFFGYQATPEKKERVTHVGIYLGDGQFIHSGDDNPGIRIQSLYPDRPGFAPHRLARLLHARRMWSEPGKNGVQWIKDSDFYFSSPLVQ